MSNQAAQGRSNCREGGEAKPAAEKAIRDGLVRADRALRGVPPVLSHLLVVSRPPLITDEVVARLRGNLSSLAKQLLDSAPRAGARDEKRPDGPDILTERLAASSIVLSYCFAQAIESETIDRLEKREQIDPVLSPLLQELIASKNDETAELAMKVLAAQSRFVQHQKRMSLPLDDLPAEIFHELLRRWEAQSKKDPQIEQAIKHLKSAYDEATGRPALLARLIGTLRQGATAALDLHHAGFAMFATALAQLNRHPRELAVLASHEGQATRLALLLRAAGLDARAIQQQFLFFAPSGRFPAEIADLAPDEAAAILTETSLSLAGG